MTNHQICTSSHTNERRARSWVLNLLGCMYNLLIKMCTVTIKSLHLRPAVDIPMHSLLRPSCDAGSQVAFHEKHKQVVVAHSHQYQARHCGLRTPVHPVNRKLNHRKNINKSKNKSPGKNYDTWIIPGWSLGLFPGHGVPSCIVQPSSGVFCALATRALIRTLNSSYSLCETKWFVKSKTVKLV